ncbi:MAG: N-carbamoylputrescine amidase [Pikeienuella sp.]
MSVCVAVTQFAAAEDRTANREKAEALVREAAGLGAKLILLQELFETPYFCKEHHARHLDLAAPFDGHPLIARFAALARELRVVLPISFFERAGPAFFDSLAMIDADGRVLGRYRKSHIPDGPGYQEKWYFSPGDTGFRVWETEIGRIGAAICWDQWFPEAARIMALRGAELLLYPTAIGSEPQDPTHDSKAHWQNAMRGHAAANLVPVLAANRIGTERAPGGTEVTFYGASFVTDWQGEFLAEADRTSDGVTLAQLDLAEAAELRSSWGVFRDRRPDLYGPLMGLDGSDT